MGCVREGEPAGDADLEGATFIWGSVYFTGNEPQYSWPQARLFEVQWYESKPLRASYGLQTDRVEMDPNLPAIFLVGPDGTILAKDLHGDDIKAAVAKALGN